MEYNRLSCAFDILIFIWIDVNYGKQTMVSISPYSCDICFCFPNLYDEWFFCVICSSYWLQILYLCFWRKVFLLKKYNVNMIIYDAFKVKCSTNCLEVHLIFHWSLKLLSIIAFGCNYWCLDLFHSQCYGVAPC